MLGTAAFHQSAWRPRRLGGSLLRSGPGAESWQL